MVTRTSYHHGALREALLAACLRLIETEGIAAVSLRRVAREAGVSSGAPYHHFADRAALLADLATQGFHLLGAEVTVARDSAPTPLAGLTAIADAYVRFARDNPGYFRLMFRPELSQPEKHPETRAAGEAAFAVLSDTVADCVAAGELPAGRADAIAVTLWGLAHGLASLWLDGQLDKRSALMGTTAAELVADIMGTFNALIAPGT